MKKYLYSILGGIIGASLMVGGVVYATTVFNSNQIGTSPVNTYIPQTNGTVTTWIAPSALGFSSFPFTSPCTNFGVSCVSTTTPVWFKQGLMASTTSYFDNASTTLLTVSSNTYLSSLSVGAPYIASNGLVLSHATSSAAVASQDVWRDGNGNVLANNFFPSVTSTVSGGGTVVMTPASTRYQILTGTLNHTYQLPNGNASGMTTGSTFDFNNNSTGLLTVTNHSGITQALVPYGGFTRLVLTDNSSSDGLWETHAYLGHNSVWGTSVVGIGTTTPFGKVAISLNFGESYTGNNAFIIASSTQNATTTIFKIDNTGSITTSLGTGCVSATSGLLSVGSACGTVTSVGFSSPNSTLTIGSTPITSSGTITGDLNLSHANNWTALQQFQNASSTTFSAGYLAVGETGTSTIDRAGNGSIAGTLNVTGKTTLGNASTTNETDSNELNVPHGTTVSGLSAGDIFNNTNGTASSSISMSDGSNTHNLFAEQTMSANEIASTTLTFSGGGWGATGTTTLTFGSKVHKWKILSYGCLTNKGTAWMGWGTGSATSSPEVQCTTTGTRVNVSSNNTFNGGQTVYYDLGTTATTPDYIKAIYIDYELQN